MPSKKKLKPVKVSDVAHAVGVTPAVVYSFLNGRYYGNGAGSRIGIAPSTRSRIRQAARDLNFIPSDLITHIRLRPERGGFLMFLSDSVAEGIGNPYFSRIFHGLSQHAAATERSVFFSTFSREVDYMAHPELLPDSILSGLVNKVVLAGEVNYSLILALRRAECWVVYASRDLGLTDVPGVVPDYQEAARLAMEYLHGLGHTRIALACAPHVNPDAYFFRKLTAGCEEAWHNMGLPDPVPRFIFPEPEDPLGKGYLETIRHGFPGVTAIFCFDDFAAIDLLNAALAQGMNIPEELSVLGCNDEIRPFMTVPLSTIHFPKALLGQRAAEILDQWSRQEGEKPPGGEVLPVELVVRSSCGPVPKRPNLEPTAP